jgi:nicotinamidase-related amidase
LKSIVGSDEQLDHKAQEAWEHCIRVKVPVDFSTIALLIIDLQNLAASPDIGMLRRLRDEGFAEGIVYPVSRIEEVVVPNVARLLSAFRAKGLPIIYSRCVSLRGDGSDQSYRHRQGGSASGTLACSVSSVEAQFLPAIAPEPDDIILNKTGQSVFASTSLEHILHNMGVSTLAVTGIWTNSCVEGTTRDAGDRNIGVVLVEDACSAFNQVQHDNAIYYLVDNFAQVKSTQQVIEALTQVAEKAPVLQVESV